MEKKLRAVSKDQYGEAIQSSASAMQKLFNQRSNKFNGKTIIRYSLSDNNLILSLISVRKSRLKGTMIIEHIQEAYS